MNIREIRALFEKGREAVVFLEEEGSYLDRGLIGISNFGTGISIENRTDYLKQELGLYELEGKVARLEEDSFIMKKFGEFIQVNYGVTLGRILVVDNDLRFKLTNPLTSLDFTIDGTNRRMGFSQISRILHTSFTTYLTNLFVDFGWEGEAYEVSEYNQKYDCLFTKENRELRIRYNNDTSEFEIDTYNKVDKYPVQEMYTMAENIREMLVEERGFDLTPFYEDVMLADGEWI